MRSNWLLISLLLLSFIISEAQGIRLRKGTISGPNDRQHNIHEIVPLKRNNDGIIDEDRDGVEICEGKECSGRTNRKLIVTTLSSTTKTAKNEINQENKDHDDPPKSEGHSTNKKTQRKQENLSVNSPSSAAITEEHRPTPEPYPDVIDIAGMDYSQARRRPPIHN